MSASRHKFGFRLNLEKTIQAVAFLMRQPGRDQHAYLKLLKLLYVAERESLLETGYTITGDTTVSLPHGPGLSRTCSLMNGSARDGTWAAHFRPTGICELGLVSDPGVDLLCPYEIEKLKAVSAHFADKNRWQTRDETHYLPEWSDPGKSSKLIMLRDILAAGGKEDRVGAIIRDEKARQAFLDALAG